MNRSREKAEELAKQFGGKVVGWGEWIARCNAGLVVGSVSAENRFCGGTSWSERWRRGETARCSLMTWCAEKYRRQVAELYNVYVYNTDDLTEIVQQNRNARRARFHTHKELSRSM